VRKVGEGAFGAVYRAVGQTSQEVYAIKVTQRACKTHEHGILCKTDGERLVKLVACFNDADFAYYVMVCLSRTRSEYQSATLTAGRRITFPRAIFATISPISWPDPPHGLS
jgi:serine/threonine protein kinase